MPLYRITAPNGKTYEIEGPPGASQAQVAAAVMARNPEAGQVPEAPTEDTSGFKAAASAGAERLKGDLALLGGKLGLMSEDEAQAYKEQKDLAAQKRFTPTQEGWLDAPWQKLKETAGGSLPYMAAPLAAGVAATGLGAPGLVAAGLGGAASAAQFTGSNLRAQMETGKSLKEADAGNAALAAIPQAALDTLSFRMMPGIGKLFGSAGAQVTEDAAKKIAQQSLKQVAADYALQTGKVMGVEGLTEAAQQVFERLQAGLNIADPEARAEYLENAIGGAAVAAFLGPLGRAQERGAIKRAGTAAEDKRQRDAILAAQEKPAAEPAPQTPAEAPSMGGGTDAKGKAIPFKATPEEAARFAALESATARGQGTADKPVDNTKPKGVIPQRDLFGQEALAATSDVPARIPDAAEVAERRSSLERQAMLLQQEITTREAQAFEAAQAGDVETARAALAEVDRMDAALKQAAAQIKELPTAPAPAKPKADPIKALVQAGEAGDRDALRRALGKAQNAPEPVPEQQDLFGKENVQRTETRNARLQPKQQTAYDRADLLSGPRDNSDLMGALRPLQEQQNAEREVQERKVRPEAEALQRIGQRETPPSRVEPALARRQTEEALVGTLIGTLPRTPETTPAGRINRGVSQTPAVDRESLLADLEVARATRNKEEVSRIVQALKDLKRPTDSQSIRDRMRAALSGGNRPLARQLFRDLQQARADEAAAQPNAGPADLAKAMGSQLPPGYAESRAPARAANATTNAFAQLIKAHRALGASSGGTRAVGSYTRVKLEDALAQAQAALLGRVSDEVAARGGDVDAQLKAVSKAEEMVALTRRIWDKNPRYALDEVRRTIDAAVAPQQPQRAEQRRKEPGPARVGIPDELTLADSPRESRDPVKAARDAVARLSGTPDREVATERVERTTPPQRGKSMQDLGAIMQQPTERLVSETRPADKDDLALLQEASDLLTPTGKDFAALVREQAERYAQGRPVDRQDLQAAIAEQRQGQRSDGAQRELFPRGEATNEKDRQRTVAVATERSTPENFQKYLDSKEVAALRKKIADGRKQVEEVPAVVARALQAADTALAEFNALQQRLGKLDKVGANMLKANEEMRAIQADVKEAAQALTDQQAALATRRKKLLEYQGSLPQTDTGTDLDTEVPNERRMVASALADIDAAERALSTEYEAERGIAETVRKDFERKFAYTFKKWGALRKAKEQLDDAMQRARDTQRAMTPEAQAGRRDEAQAEKRREATDAYARSIQRAREGLGLPGTRVVRDTTARAVEKQAVGLKRAIGSLTEQVADARRAGDDAKVNELIGRRENAMSKLAGVFEAAPAVRKDLNSPEEEAAFAEYEAAQRAFEVSEAKRRLGQGEAAPALGPRRKGALMRGQTSEPRSLRTASPESLKGENVTNVGSRPEQAGKLPAVDRNRGDYQAEANRIAEEIRGKGVDPAAAAKRMAEAEAKEARRLARENRPARDDKVPDVDEDALYQKAQESAEAPLSDKAQEALRNDDVVTALKDVAKNSSNPLNRAVATRLAALLGDTQVVLNPDLKNDKGEPAFGAASGDGLTIWLNPTGGMNEETLLHEAVHAATERVLRMDDALLSKDTLAAKRELQALHAAIKRDVDITSVDAKASLSEFVAEAMSNPVLQAQMAKKPWRLQNAWENFQKLVLRLLGITTPPTNQRDAAIAAIDTLFRAPKAEQAAAGGTRYQSKRESIIARDRTWRDTRDANAGLAFRTQFIDRYAPLEKVASYIKDSVAGMQMMSYLRLYGQRMSLVGQAVSNGALQITEKTRKDGKTERLIESRKGASLKMVAEELRDGPLKDAKRAEDLFTLDLLGRRAARVGWDKLDFKEPDRVKAEVAAARAEIASVPGLRESFDRASALYNDYNKGMMQFMVQTGAISKDTFDELTAAGDYVPFYRQRGGNADLIIGKETPIRIGNLKDSPHLKELVGGATEVLPFMTSAVQNTSLLTDLAIRNIGAKNVAFEMATMGLGKIGEGSTAGTNVIEFKDKGVDKHLLLDEEAMADIGIPADLLVKGLAGIPTMLPAGMRLLAMPARLLRKAVTLSPVYAARQLFRDSLAASMTSGANFTPVLSSLKQLGKKGATTEALNQRGITGGQVFTGTGEDISKILRDITDGKSPMRMLGQLEALSMEADAATRRAQYDSYIKQGLSEMEATMMSLESMNFTRQGLSPTVHMIGQLVPFFNAQIQGLDVLYRALRGRMPMDEQLQIRRKLITRGTMLAVSTLAYAAAMQDDEAYKNATPEERAMNWFVRVPGLDEPVRVPIPFEIGYVFKALPEALFNTMAGDQTAQEGFKTLNTILLNTMPGGSNMATVNVNGYNIPLPLPPLPQAFKPAIEAWTGTSLFTRRPLETGAEAALEPGYRAKDNTSEIAKELGQLTGMSPIIIENTVRGYTSALGLMVMQLASAAFPESGGPEKAVKRLSELPLIGTAFQPNDGLHLVNTTYERLKEIEQVKATFEKLAKSGERAEAERYLQENINKLSMAAAGGNMRSMLDKIVQAERAVRAASGMTGQEKREQLDELRRLKIEVASSIRASLETR